MATKEDVDNLNAKLDSVTSAVDLVAQDTAALKEELKALNESANIDLSGAIAKAESIEARLTGIAGPNIGSDPDDTAPPTEPPAEG